MTDRPKARLSGPHQALQAGDERERFTLELFDRLWDRYRGRVLYATKYEQIVAEAGATFVNDHIAFRTVAAQRPPSGIASLSRIFEALGFQAADCYNFPDKRLNAIHFQHSHPQFPKLFISELRSWELTPAARAAIQRTLQDHRPPSSEDTLAALHSLNQLGDQERARLADEVLDWFHRTPWTAPDKEDVLTVNQESQYAAWVLVHGYNVNHFTSLINSHGVPQLADIEKTVAALRLAGVPMKAEIEGQPGSKLRQSASEAVMIDVEVRDQGQTTQMPWTYAYFELAERGEISDPETGGRRRFEGFLGPQATHLFEMTRVDQ